MTPYTPPEPACTVSVYEVNTIFWEAGHEYAGLSSTLFTESQLRSEVERVRRETMEECVALRAEVEAFDKAEDSWMRKAIELEAEVGRFKKQVIRAANFELDLLRALDGQVTLCGFAEIAEVEKLKADNLDLRSDEALNEAEALIRQAGAALLPHKSTVLRWYTPVDAAIDAIEEYFK